MDENGYLILVFWLEPRFSPILTDHDHSIPVLKQDPKRSLLCQNIICIFKEIDLLCTNRALPHYLHSATMRINRTHKHLFHLLIK